MKALISPIEAREQGCRVAQVEEVEFDVAAPLFWVDCDDTIKADKFWYNLSDETFNVIPEIIEAVKPENLLAVQDIY